MSSSTKDGQKVEVDVSLEVGLDRNKIPVLHNKVGRDWFNIVVFPTLRSIMRTSAAPSVLSDEIITDAGRSQVRKILQDELQKHVVQYGINVSVNLRDVRFQDNSFSNLLEEKAKAAQRVVIEERNALAAIETAKRTANIAEGEKQKRIKAAEADREERRLAGEGERLKQEETAKGILAVAKAEAEGARLQVQAYGDGNTYASVKWAENMGPNVKVYGFPTGAPGTASLMDLNGVFNGVFPKAQ
jgi:regulator of protease activity HflC (stomatin/prohibitin superfamily)